MNSITIKCTDTNVSYTADILLQTDKRLEVVIGEGTKSMKLVLSRTSIKSPYVGRMHGLEFTAQS